MNVATASPALARSRRRLLTALFASTGALSSKASGLDPALARRQPGDTGVREQSLPLSPAALSFPPAAVRWLTRCTFGYTPQELAAFNTLGGSDDVRWQAWVDKQLDPATIDDSDCDTRIANAGYVTLNKSGAQLWADHHSVTNDYYLRMLPITEAECATILRQNRSQRQLYEVMVDFWHDHFSVYGRDYDGGPMFPAFDRDAIRPYGKALGNFRDMLQAVGESASMMYMLDLYANESGQPNENYARELMELHTLGAENYGGIVQNPDSYANMEILGHYTDWEGEEQRLKYVDDDVYDAARAMTGWTISGTRWPYDPIAGVPLGEFAYDNSRHDQLTKHILARYMTGYQQQADGTFLYDMLAQHPGTAQHVARKICRRFVGDAPPTALVQQAADVFHANWEAPDQITQVLRVILDSDAFKSSWGTKMKRPALAAVSALRACGAEFTPLPDNTSTYTPTEEFMGRLQATGHRLFNWPAPNGYPDDQVTWSSTGTLGMTLRMLPRLLDMHQVESYNNANPFLIDIHGKTLTVFPDAATRTAANLMDYWCQRILGYQPASVHTLAVDFLRQNTAANTPQDLVTDSTDGGGNPQHVGTWNLNDLWKHYTIARLRTAVGLILCSPEFLRR